MKDTEPNYDVSCLIKDVLGHMGSAPDESSLLDRIAPLVQRAAKTPGLVTESMFEADPELGFGSTLLHSESDHSLFIVIDSWLPGRGVNPHDHGTWAVVVGIEGTETNIWWQRKDDGSDPEEVELQKIREHKVRPGDVIVMPAGEIHSVLNLTDKSTLSLHVYGRHLNYTGRSQFDLENGREIPFLVDIQ